MKNCGSNTPTFDRRTTWSHGVADGISEQKREQSRKADRHGVVQEGERGLAERARESMAGGGASIFGQHDAHGDERRRHEMKH